MDRLQKKCLIASCGMHGILLVILIVGTAFFVPEKKNPPVETLTMVPSRLIDGALSGGGGNPNIPRTEARIKGETLDPAPPQPQVAKPQPKPVEPPKPAPAPAKVAVAKPKEAPIVLKPVKPGDRKPKVDPAAKAREDAKASQQQLARAIGKVRESMRQGFTSGTAVEVSGPGGEAYASYRSFVFAAYDNAWQVQPDVANEESAVLAKVVVHRTGRIISAEIVRRSGNVVIDKSVRSALDRVTSLPPFPEGARDQERSFTIEFSLKAKRLIG